MIRLAQVTGSVLGETGIDLGNDTVVACDAALLHGLVEESRW